MSKKNNNPGKNSLKTETLQAIFAVLFLALAVFFILAAFQIAGPAGTTIYTWIHDKVLGVGYFMLPLMLLVLSAAFLKSIHQNFSYLKIGGSFVMFLSGLGLVEILFANETGLIGKLVSYPFLRLFGAPVGIIFLSAIIIICFFVIFDTGLDGSFIVAFWNRLTTKKKKIKITAGDEESLEAEKTEKVKAAKEPGEDEVENEEIEEEEPVKPAVPKEKPVKVISGSEKGEFAVNQNQFKYLGKKIVPIPLNLLEKDRGTPGVGDIKANINTIKRTLQNFGIIVEMDEVTVGPTVTRYALKPAEGVKLSRIVGLQNDLSLALAAHPLRIEAPIPGKSLLGIEIPNTTKTIVGLASMLQSQEFQSSDKPLLVALGKSIAGKCTFGNLAKMPHLLIAGATGSGKSVTIHAIITSLLYRNSPENLKLILIDPKRVELTLYNKIPHLLTPVITEAKKTILALKWATKEMDRRYDILEAEKVRDIESYHKNVLAPALKNLEGKSLDENGDSPKVPETMPYIVIVIDELADIMTTYPRELESSVVRLAQMSRAVGIHLILSTQRPSVNVITGLIKANVPSRIALQVASQIDSRTILDTGGAEKLLGSGDMLYLSGEMSKPSRLQSAFISEKEVKSVTKFLIDSYVDELPSELNITDQPEENSIFQDSLDDDGELGDDDDLYEAAREEVIRAGKASTSYLQRKLSVGYARAARLIDMLEEHGVIGPGHGAKPREVLEKTPATDETGQNIMN